MAGVGSKPGERRGGRKKGVPNKASAAQAAAIAASGMTPLDFLLSVMRNGNHDWSTRVDAGKAAAPYVHPKLSSMELTGRDGAPLAVNVTRFGAGEGNSTGKPPAIPKFK